jgi:Zn-dependent peptidase ImmA (M78 family)
LEIAEKTGVDVVFADMGVHRDKVAGFCDFEGSKLYVNKSDPTTRQTFTMAHELGHWVMHREFFLQHPDRYPVLPRFQSVDESNVFEREANCFAANLLVPTRLLKPIRAHNVAMLARIFAVSTAMMEIRLKNV